VGRLVSAQCFPHQSHHAVLSSVSHSRQLAIFKFLINYHNLATSNLNLNLNLGILRAICGVRCTVYLLHTG
jgi:hypothetical protein